MDHVVPIEGLVLRGTHGPRLATSGLISAIAIGFVGALFIFITPPMLALMAEGARLNDSQIGYVAAAIGLISGMLFLGESYRLETWLGAVLISIGLVMTTKAQTRTSEA
jgi:drug/metabolite transporter (DMT)-like permease